MTVYVTPSLWLNTQDERIYNMVEVQSFKEYNDILDAVCEITAIKKERMCAPSLEDEMIFACGLYLQLVSESGLSHQKAILLINKARPTISLYTSVVERELRHSRVRYEQYRACCKKLGKPAKFKEHTEEMRRLSDAQIRKRIGELPKGHHNTMAEEIAIVSACESAEEFFRHYGKGVQPLKEGYAITRRKR